MGGEGEKRERRKIRAQARFASGEKRKTFPFFFFLLFSFFSFCCSTRSKHKSWKKDEGGKTDIGRV